MNSEPFVQKPFIPENLFLSRLCLGAFLFCRTRTAVGRRRRQLTLVNTAVPIRDNIDTIDIADNRTAGNQTGPVTL
jgi:hypothetical protein